MYGITNTVNVKLDNRVSCSNKKTVLKLHSA